MNRQTDFTDEWIDLVDAINALPSKQGRALALVYQGYTQAEIGEVLGLDQSSVCRLLEKAINSLKNA